MASFVNRILLACSMALATALAHADTVPPGDDLLDTVGVIPEPGVLGLLAIGGAVGIALALKNRRK